MDEKETPQAGAGESSGQESTDGKDVQTESTPTGAPGAQSGTVDDLPDWAQSLIGDLRKENAGHRKAKGEAEKAAQEAEEKRLAEEKRWQELAEKRQAELEKANSELSRVQHEALVRDVAQAAGLPPALAGRLRGSTREELEADAKELAKLIPAQTQTPGAPAGPQRTGAPDPEQDEARKAELRQRYRI